MQFGSDKDTIAIKESIFDTESIKWGAGCMFFFKTKYTKKISNNIFKKVLDQDRVIG